MTLLKTLRHYFEDYADAQIAKHRFNDPKSRIISGLELRKRQNTVRWPQKKLPENVTMPVVSG